MSVETSTTDLRPDEPPQGPDAGLLLNAIAKIIFYSLVMLLGLFGNSLILGVYWPKPNKTSTQILIMGLAGMDLTVCLMRVYNLTMYLMFIQNKETPSAVEYIGVIGLVNMFASSVLTGFIALDRYDCVCRRPADRWLNRNRAKMMILGAYAGAMLFASPRILEVIWLPATLALQKTFLVFQIVLYILVLGVICVCYGQVYVTVQKHVKVNVPSERHAHNDLSTTMRVPSSRHGAIPAIADKVQVTLPKSSDGGPPSTSRRPERSEAVGLPAGVAIESRNDQPMTATQGNVNSAPTGRPRRNVNPNQLKCEAVSLQRKTTRMMFGTSVVLLVTWFPYWLYVALSLFKLSGAPIPMYVTKAVYYCTVSVFINNIFNPIIYGLANRRFRKDCLHAMKKMKLC
ncbi:cholecystokinin receptor-like [Asterias amurensis]|uniref:cholecystokinin receptor-like n=1 Tax=Asterias amurensis TaxID=7602 RepID=UPI003AB520C7